ncbi:hypothetical protein [Mesorhizobium escarrei]|uniref:hypothetical protein n=1 Tax=Mesorhizobium escarrei TaxID=666018 RepID=UPI0020A71DA2|nr:hypothetical protein [Mesorhizobium escarrei]
MEVARYVGDAAPNGKLFWHFGFVFGPRRRDRAVGEPGGYVADSLTARTKVW